jgi:hypothetical protein
MSANTSKPLPVGGRPDRRRVHPGLFAAFVVVVFAGVIGIGGVIGAWQLTGRPSGNGTGDGTGDGSGRSVVTQGLDVAEIKGWMAIGDVADAFSVPLPDVLATFSLPPDTPPSTALKDLESDSFSVAALRDWLEAHATGATEGEAGV